MTSDFNGRSLRTILSEDDNIAQPRAIAIYDNSECLAFYIILLLYIFVALKPIYYK